METHQSSASVPVACVRPAEQIQSSLSRLPCRSLPPAGVLLRGKWRREITMALHIFRSPDSRRSLPTIRKSAARKYGIASVTPTREFGSFLVFTSERILRCSSVLGNANLPPSSMHFGAPLKHRSVSTGRIDFVEEYHRPIWFVD